MRTLRADQSAWATTGGEGSAALTTMARRATSSIAADAGVDRAKSNNGLWGSPYRLSEDAPIGWSDKPSTPDRSAQSAIWVARPAAEHVRSRQPPNARMPGSGRNDSATARLGRPDCSRVGATSGRGLGNPDEATRACTDWTASRYGALQRSWNALTTRSSPVARRRPATQPAEQAKKVAPAGPHPNWSRQNCSRTAAMAAGSLVPKTASSTAEGSKRAPPSSTAADNESTRPSSPGPSPAFRSPDQARQPEIGSGEC